MRFQVQGAFFPFFLCILWLPLFISLNIPLIFPHKMSFPCIKGGIIACLVATINKKLQTNKQTNKQTTD